MQNTYVSHSKIRYKITKKLRISAFFKWKSRVFFQRNFAFSLAMSQKIANFARDFEHLAPKSS